MNRASRAIVLVACDWDPELMSLCNLESDIAFLRIDCSACVREEPEILRADAVASGISLPLRKVTSVI